MLGLRFFSGRVRAELGRYLGDRRVAYYCATTPGVPSGHFAFATVWFFLDDHRWYREPAGSPGAHPLLAAARPCVGVADRPR